MEMNSVQKGVISVPVHRSSLEYQEVLIC